MLQHRALEIVVSWQCRQRSGKLKRKMLYKGMKAPYDAES
jgi:hypothetical protein